MQKALAPEISTWPDENPQLIGSRVRRLRGHHLPGAAALPALQRRRV